MENNDKAKRTQLSVVDAVETLSTIADLEFDHEITTAKEEEISRQNELVLLRARECLHDEELGHKGIVKAVKETFYVILNHLRNVYDNDHAHLSDQETIEGIKNIMVIVGEAAKKLDKYTTLFRQTKEKSVTNLREFHQLQEFYLRKVAKIVDESMLSKWVMALSFRMLTSKSKVVLEGEPLKKTQAKHVFVDLDTVKKDDEYELFFVRKDDGTRFFSPRLLRNIKLVCDFGDTLSEKRETDILSEVKLWFDYVTYASSNQILRIIIPLLSDFRHETQHIQRHELVADLNKAIMALMLSSHEKQLLRNIPTKSCQEYFADFQFFLRQALHRTEYQKMITYPPNKANKVANAVLGMAHALCCALYQHVRGMQEVLPHVTDLIAQASSAQSQEHAEASDLSHTIWNRMAGDYAAMNRLMKKRHPHGPLLKVLDILDEEAYHAFDPLMQHNLPCQLYTLESEDSKISHVRFAAPIHQEYINSAKVIEEFKGMLRESVIDKGRTRHLLINLEDKTSWREYGRCSALEDLPHVPDLEKKIFVATLAKDTDFYWQEDPYNQQNHTDLFMEQFKEHLDSDNAGFYFPAHIKEELLKSGFIDHAVEAVHQLFFSGKNVLTQEQRQDFIEIFYILLQLKLIDLVQPTSFSLTCKDGIDVGEASSAGIFIFLKLLNKGGLDHKDWDYLNFMLYGPAILIRERTLLADPFNRLLSVVKRIEFTRNELGEDIFLDKIHKALDPLYLTAIWQSDCRIPE